MLDVNFKTPQNYSWNFTKTDLNFSIIGLDFLNAHKLTVDVRNGCLIDKENDLTIPLSNRCLIDKENDLQIYVHRIGVKKTSRNAKPRPVIVRFVSYQKRNEFLFEKSKLKKSMHFGNAFITEDLTPLRSKLLRYVKKECDNDFVLCHSYNGKIRMKKSAQKTGLSLDKNGNDQGTGK